MGKLDQFVKGMKSEPNYEFKLSDEYLEQFFPFKTAKKCKTTLLTAGKSYRIFQTIRRTFPPTPKFGRKTGVCQVLFTFTLVKYYVIYLLNILPHFLLQKIFSYFPPLKPRCVLWSKNMIYSFISHKCAIKVITFCSHPTQSNETSSFHHHQNML